MLRLLPELLYNNLPRTAGPCYAQRLLFSVHLVRVKRFSSFLITTSGSCDKILVKLIRCLILTFAVAGIAVEYKCRVLGEQYYFKLTRIHLCLSFYCSTLWCFVITKISLTSPEAAGGSFTAGAR